jgi:hypothetical protein
MKQRLYVRMLDLNCDCSIGRELTRWAQCAKVVPANTGQLLCIPQHKLLNLLFPVPQHSCARDQCGTKLIQS